MEQTLETPAEQIQHTDETPLEFFASICGVLVLGLFVLTFIFQNFEIPSGSMEKTLLVGDHVVVDRVGLAPPDQMGAFRALPRRASRRRDRLLQARRA